MFRFSTCHQREVTPALLREWKKLWDESTLANTCNSHQWFQMAIASGNCEDATVFTIRDDDKLVGIVALEQQRVFGLGALVPLYGNFVVETPFLLSSDDPSLLKFFLRNLEKRGNFYLAKVDGDLAWQFRAIDTRLFPSLMSVNPYVDTTQDPLRHLTASNRKELLRIERKLGDRLHASLTSGQDGLQGAFSAMVAIDLESGKQKKAMDIFSKAENRELFGLFIKHLHEFVHIGIVSIDGVPASYIFNFISKKKCLNYQTSYLDRFRKYSPGKLIILAMSRAVESKGLAIFDFCGGISAYKREFAPSYRVQYSVYWSTSAFTLLWWKSINLIRRIKQRVLPIPNTLDHEFLFRTDRVEDHAV